MALLTCWRITFKGSGWQFFVEGAFHHHNWGECHKFHEIRKKMIGHKGGK
jgi:hypothetical protein